MKKRDRYTLAGTLLLLVLSACQNTPPQSSKTTPAIATPVSLHEDTIAQTRPSDRLSATVVSTGDGDTLTLNLNGENVTTRLVCIDTPESSAPFGPEASNRLRQLLPRGAAVNVRPVDRDRYGRLVAEVYLGDQSVNLRLVREGYAVIYRQYFDGCADTQQAYLAAEADAQQNRRVFWSQQNPIMPWDWRQGARQTTQPNTPARTTAPPAEPRPAASATPAPRTRGNCDPSYPGVCIPPAPPDLDCGDISYRRFTVRQPDPHRFDSDRDGVGYEG